MGTWRAASRRPRPRAIRTPRSGEVCSNVELVFINEDRSTDCGQTIPENEDSCCALIHNGASLGHERNTNDAQPARCRESPTAAGGEGNVPSRGG